jgi:hypothetical protein
MRALWLSVASPATDCADHLRSLSFGLLEPATPSDTADAERREDITVSTQIQHETLGTRTPNGEMTK